jgi:hypothetical protein
VSGPSHGFDGVESRRASPRRPRVVRSGLLTTRMILSTHATPRIAMFSRGQGAWDERSPHGKDAKSECQHAQHD